MNGHFLACGVRKLNRHYQSGGKRFLPLYPLNVPFRWTDPVPFMPMTYNNYYDKGSDYVFIINKGLFTPKRGKVRISLAIDNPTFSSEVLFGELLLTIYKPPVPGQPAQAWNVDIHPYGYVIRFSSPQPDFEINLPQSDNQPVVSRLASRFPNGGIYIPTYPNKYSFDIDFTQMVSHRPIQFYLQGAYEYENADPVSNPGEWNVYFIIEQI